MSQRSQKMGRHEKKFPFLGGTDQRFSPTMKARIPPDVVNYLLQTGVSEGQKNRCRRRWKQVTPPERNVVCMQLEQRFFHEIPSYQLNKVRTVGDHLQLLMKIRVLLSNGAEKDLYVLVDTGAEANLVRKGLLSDSLMRNAREPLSFVTASGQPLEGGKRTAKLTLFFEQVVSRQKLPNARSLQANFYEAEIGVDAILSFSWMAIHKIGVFPHHQALALEEPVLHSFLGLGAGARAVREDERITDRFAGNGCRKIFNKLTFRTRTSKNISCPFKKCVWSCLVKVLTNPRNLRTKKLMWWSKIYSRRQNRCHVLISRRVSAPGSKTSNRGNTGRKFTNCTTEPSFVKK